MRIASGAKALVEGSVRRSVTTKVSECREALSTGHVVVIERRDKKRRRSGILPPQHEDTPTERGETSCRSRREGRRFALTLGPGVAVVQAPELPRVHHSELALRRKLATQAPPDFGAKADSRQEQAWAVFRCRLMRDNVDRRQHHLFRPLSFQNMSVNTNSHLVEEMVNVNL